MRRSLPYRNGRDPREKGSFAGSSVWLVIPEDLCRAMHKWPHHYTAYYGSHERPRELGRSVIGMTCHGTSKMLDTSM